MPVTVISPGEAFQGQHKTYRIHTTHTYLLSIIGYVRLQVHKERDTNIIYLSYANDMAHKLSLLNSTEAWDIKTTPVHSLIMDATSALWHKRLCHKHTKGIGRISKVVNGIPTFIHKLTYMVLMYDLAAI